MSAEPRTMAQQLERFDPEGRCPYCFMVGGHSQHCEGLVGHTPEIRNYAAVSLFNEMLPRVRSLVDDREALLAVAQEIIESGAYGMPIGTLERLNAAIQRATTP